MSIYFKKILKLKKEKGRAVGERGLWLCGKCLDQMFCRTDVYRFSFSIEHYFIVYRQYSICF